MKIMVFGAGALGSVLGGFLSEHHEVTLIAREKHVSAINNRGLRVSGIWGEHTFRELNALASAEELNTPQAYILITTKAYDTEEAVKSISHVADENTAIVSFQNGIGNEEIIARAFGEERTLGGMAIFGAVLKAPGEVEVTVYAGECRVGELAGKSRKAEIIAEALNRAGIPTVYTGDIIRDKWMKLFYNSALNPLSAILRVNYGALGELKETRELMKNLIREAFSVAKAKNVNLEVTAEEYIELFFEKLLPATRGHKSSMLQDMEKGKKTEIDFLNGAVVKLGKKHGIAVPYNESLVALIKFLESNPQEV